MDKTTHEVRIANWRSIIEQCQARPEGQSAKQWLIMVSPRRITIIGSARSDRKHMPLSPQMRLPLQSLNLSLLQSFHLSVPKTKNGVSARMP